MKLFFKNRAFLVIFSIITLLILLEISLRLAGIIYIAVNTHGKFSSYSRNTQKQNRDDFTVLCLGDSFTYGMGTSYEYSYPKQLEKMFNDSGFGKVVNIYNLGSPGGNSRRIIKIFKESINKYNPQLAIVMVGQNNRWNLEGREQFCHGSVIKKLRLSLYNLRIYKLAKILAMNLRNKFAGVFRDKDALVANGKIVLEVNEKVANGRQRVNISDAEWGSHRKRLELYRETNRSDLAIAEINNMLNRYPEAPQLQHELILFLREKGDYDLALEYAKKTLASIPNDPQYNADTHRQMAYIYTAKKDWQAARQELDYAVYDFVYIQSIFPELKNICNKESGLDFDKEAGKIRKLVNKIYGEKRTEIWDELLYLDKNQTEQFKMLGLDLIELIDIAKKNEIELILMTYPSPDLFNEVIRQAALRYNIELIDNELIFKENLSKESLFVADGHCNIKGYKLIAHNIYFTLFKIGILSKNTTGTTK